MADGPPIQALLRRDALWRSGGLTRDIEAIVCSHGHFDHTAGLDGLIRRMGQVRLPVLIHPDFWNRRRVRVPGRDPLEIPTTSRSALRGAGFEIIEERRPSFLFDNSVLVTGEVDRATGYEPGFPVQDAWLNGPHGCRTCCSAPRCEPCRSLCRLRTRRRPEPDR